MQSGSPFATALADAARSLSMPSSVQVIQQSGQPMLTAPRPPSKPITSYLRFSKKIWEKVKVDRPNAPVWETSQIIGQMWRDLSDQEKGVYVAEYEADKEEYKKAFEAYRVALADYQEAVGAAQQIAENNRLLLEAEQAAQLFIHQVPYLNMPIRMKPEPVDQTGGQAPYIQQVDNILAAAPHMLRHPGPGQLFLPQNVQVPTCNPPAPPPPADVSGGQKGHANSSVHKEQSPAGEDKKTEENIEDRIDIDSIRGIFGWATIDTVNVPYIVRKYKKYVAVRIVEKKLLSRYPNSFPDELGKKEPLVSYFVTENEAKLLDEINQVHCSYEYGHQPFSCKDLIVDMTEFEDFYNLVKKTFPDDYLAKLRGDVPQVQPSQPQQQVPSEMKHEDHEKSNLAKVCGWVQINNTVSPYIRRFSGKFVPLSVIKYAAGLLTDLQIDGTIPSPAECNLLNETCKAAGFDFTFGQNTKVIHLSEVTQRCPVNIIELPFDDPLKHAQYLDLPSPSKPPQSTPSSMSLPQKPPTNMMAAPNVDPFSGYPSAPPNPYFNMMPIMSQRFPQHYPMPPQGQRFPFMNPQNVPHQRPNMGSSMRQGHPSPNQVTSQHQFQSGHPNNTQNPLSMMSQMTQMTPNGQMHPMPPGFPNQLPAGVRGPMNQVMRPGQSSPSNQIPGVPSQGMRMPMCAPTDMLRAPTLHTAQMPQLSPSQSTISRMPNPHSSAVQQVDNQNTSRPSSTSYPMSSPAMEMNPKPVAMQSPMSGVNGETLSRPGSNHSSGHSRPCSRSLVDQISGVLLNGKSISCMHLESAEVPGKYCLVEAVCKLYFSQSSMGEFLFAVQNVLKVPLHSCNNEEEKAFIQYYNLPVNALKCNKMISLADLEKYFPQMSYMFSQSDIPNDVTGTPQMDSVMNKSGQSVTDASASASPNETDAANGNRKRPLVGGGASAPPAKVPCRRLEDMVRKLKQSQNTSDSPKTDEPQQAAETLPDPAPAPAPADDDAAAAAAENQGKKDEVIILD